MRRIGRALAATVVLGSVMIAGAGSAGADGSITLHRTDSGCETVRDFGVGLQGDGIGTLDVEAGPGPIVAAFAEWAGQDDTTPNDIVPGGPRADSTITINGVEVVGIQPPGEAGYAPEGRPDPWYSWYADVGPTGLGLVTTPDAMSLDVSGFDSDVGRFNNGLSLVVVYDTSPCTSDSLVEVRTGVDYYWRGLPGDQGLTLPIQYDFTPADFDRTATFFINHAGTDASQTVCRGDAIWMVAGSGDAPTKLVDIDPGTGAGIGINGAVEAIDDPFGDDSLPCSLVINPDPDIPYEAGHPYPAGASAAPYRILSADRDFDPEWTRLRFEMVVPAGAEWVVFQMESEEDQTGESGASVGGGPFVLTPSIPVTSPVDVSLTKSVSAAADGPFTDEITVNIGDTVYWELVVSAAAGDADGDPLGDVSGLTVVDAVPDGVVVVGSTGDGSFDASTGTWTIGDLAAGTSARMVLETQMNVLGRRVNTAEVSTHNETDIDSTPGNGVQDPDEDDDDSAAVNAGAIDVELDKRVDGEDGPVDRVAGATITYTVDVSARSETPDGEPLDDVSGLVVTDLLPEAVTYVSHTGPGTYDPTTGRWAIGDLAAGSSVALDIVVTIDDDAPVEFDNVAQVSEHDQPDIDSTPGNGPQDPAEDDDDAVTVKLPGVSPTTAVNPTTTTTEATTTTSTTAPGSSSTTTPAPTTTGDVDSGNELPRTGGESDQLGWVGILTIILGVDLLIMALSMDRIRGHFRRT